MKHELTDLIHMLSHWVHQEESLHTHSHYNGHESHDRQWQENEDLDAFHGPHKSATSHQHPHITEYGQHLEQDHEHEVLAILNQMFQDTDPEQAPYQKTTVEIDVDKHLAEEPGELPTPIYSIQPNNFPLWDKNTYRSDFPPLTPPPEQFYRSLNINRF